MQNRLLRYHITAIACLSKTYKCRVMFDIKGMVYFSLFVSLCILNMLLLKCSIQCVLLFYTMLEECKSRQIYEKKLFKYLKSCLKILKMFFDCLV
jgi:hypothetical protein